MTDRDSYQFVELPDPQDKPYEDWDAAERRAWMLQRINEAGHPRPFVQKDIAAKFDVSAPMITKDMRALADDIVDTLGERELADIATIIRSSVMEVHEDPERDPMDSIDAAKEWFDWLAQSGAVERAPDKQEVKQDVEMDADVTSTFDVTWDAVDDADTEEAGGDDG